MQRRTFLAAPFFLGRVLAARPVVVRSVAELHSAVAAAKPGDTIFMEDGVWVDADIRFEGEGEWGRPITLRATTPGKVILSGNSRVRMAGKFLVADGLYFRDGFYLGDVVSFRTSTTRLASYCRLTRCAIVDYNVPDPTRDTKWISIYGYRNRVDRCYAAGKTNVGTTLVVWLPAGGPPNHHWIERNHFGFRPPLTVNGGETIRVGDSATSMQSSMTVVENNYFESCNGEAEIVSNKSCENIYRYNTFENCEGALTLRHGNRCLVDSNFFIGNGKPRTGGVRIIGEDHRVINNYFEGLTGTSSRAAISLVNGIVDSPLSGYFQVKRAMIAFNMTIACAQPFVSGLGAGTSAQILPPEDCAVAGNLLSGNRTPLVQILEPRSGLHWAANVFDGAAAGLPDVSVVDAALERYEDEYWMPGPESPALERAPLALADVAEDILGRPRQDPTDIGCYQRSEQPARRSRLRAKHVGPDWLARSTA